MEPSDPAILPSTQKTATPHLSRLPEFQAALANYHLNDDAQQTLDNTSFAILIGPSSSGRNTIIKRLLGTGRYHFIISDTTRPPRYNNGVLEKDGVEYWFRQEDDMLADVQAGKFLEAEIIHEQQVSGVSIRELEKAHDEHKIAITDVDIGGVHNIVKLKPDTSVILILPPSFEEWQQRLHARGNMSNIEHRRRLDTALRIFTAVQEHDYFKVVINQNLDEAAKQVDAIASTGTVDPQLQARGLALVKELLEATRQVAV
jgi:guanylate kinase